MPKDLKIIPPLLEPDLKLKELRIFWKFLVVILLRIPNMISAIQNPILLQLSSSGKKNKFGHVLGVVQLIHRLIQADISCTTMTHLFFFHCLATLQERGIHRGRGEVHKATV